MMGEVSNVRTNVDDDNLEDIDDESMTETVVLTETEATDNVGDASVEINVEELISKIEQTADEVSERKKKVRRRLEELAESKALDDTFAIEFDD
jgi:hypothetical protein